MFSNSTNKGDDSVDDLECDDESNDDNFGVQSELLAPEIVANKREYCSNKR